MFQGQVPCPAYLTDNPAKPGGYLSCFEVFYKTTQLFYLLNHSDLLWVNTNSTHMMTLPSPVKVDGGTPFYFGRIVENGFTYIGKLHAGNGNFCKN